MAGVFLFGAVLPFFQEFGFIIVFTILASYLWAMVFFTAACSILGPEHTFGNMDVMFQKARKTFARPSANAAS